MSVSLDACPCLVALNVSSPPRLYRSLSLWKQSRVMRIIMKVTRRHQWKRELQSRPGKRTIQRCRENGYLLGIA